MRLRIPKFKGQPEVCWDLPESLVWDIKAELQRDVIKLSLLEFSCHMKDLKHIPSNECVTNIPDLKRSPRLGELTPCACNLLGRTPQKALGASS